MQLVTYVYNYLSFPNLQVGLETEDSHAFMTVVDDLERALKMAPESPFMVYSLASTYHRIAGATQSMQQLELARVKFEEAMKKFPVFVDGLILYSLVGVARAARRLESG